MSNPIINKMNLINNLIPSVIGVVSPKINNPGPMRCWTKARILRSAKLKKTT